MLKTEGTFRVTNANSGGTFAMNSVPQGAQGFIRVFIDATYDSGAPLTFGFDMQGVGLQIDDLNFGTLFDDGINRVDLVQAIAPVPLAGGFPLLAAGLGSLVVLRRRHSASKATP